MFSGCSAGQELLEKAAKYAYVNPNAPIHVHWKEEMFCLANRLYRQFGFWPLG